MAVCGERQEASIDTAGDIRRNRMEAMELRISTRMEPGILPEIQWNNEELKTAVLEKAKEYQSIAYTDTDAAAMKKDKAKINKFITAMEDERKRVKAFYNEPYEKFNAQVKDVLQPMRQTVQIIDQGLNEIEQKYREEKTELCRKYYDRHVGDLEELLPFERTVREEYYKRAFTRNKLEQAYMDFFGRIREDLKALDELPERFRDKAALEYMRSFSLSDALREGKRLEEAEKALEARRKKQKEEAATKREVEKKREETTKMTSIIGERQQEVQEPSETLPIAQDIAKEQPDIFQIDFRVWGTKEQIMGMRQYLLDNNIKFGKVE